MNLKFLFSAFDILFQKNCLVCGSFSHSEICHRCQLPQSSLKNISRDNFSNKIRSIQAVDNYYSVWEYSDNARDFCAAMKYQPSIRLISYAAFQLSEKISCGFENCGWDYLIAVPSSAQGMQRRGFNHIAVLCKLLLRDKRLKQLVYKEALRLNRIRKAQAKLSRSQRLSGLHLRYKTSSKMLLSGKRILLVDDVMTTGSTATAAALALKKAGAEKIDVLTLCYVAREK